LLGVLFLPLVAVVAGADQAYRESSSTKFCLSCHEMEDYGRSLFVDDRTVLPAVHYQKRLVDRDHACFECHTNYAMFGDLRAKVDGLQHVWVHYTSGPPDSFELYEPYPNANCLHCHDDARGFLEAPAHAGQLEAVVAGETSCMQCHASGHGLDVAAEGEFWLHEP
jgi:cytochrome c-type protein NapC